MREVTAAEVSAGVRKLIADSQNEPRRGRPPVGELAGRKVKVLTILHEEDAQLVHHVFICESERKLINVLASYCRKNWLFPLHPVCPLNDSDVIDLYYEEDEDINYVIQDTFILAP